MLSARQSGDLSEIFSFHIHNIFFLNCCKARQTKIVPFSHVFLFIVGFHALVFLSADKNWSGTLFHHGVIAAVGVLISSSSSCWLRLRCLACILPFDGFTNGH